MVDAGKACGQRRAPFGLEFRGFDEGNDAGGASHGKMSVIGSVSDERMVDPFVLIDGPRTIEINTVMCVFVLFCNNVAPCDSSLSWL